VDGQPLIIGKSVKGRPLEVYRFGRGPARRMIVADIHGGYEANTAGLAKALIDYLSKHAALVPAGQTLYILPSFNPDGYARGSLPEGRANANGVDLNRNWDAAWQADWQKAGCWDKLPISAGKGPGSEPETQALAQFLKDHQVEALISYHSAGAVIYAGGLPPDAASTNLAALLSRVSGYRYPPESICAYSGQLIDWASANGITAVDVELTNHAETDFAINLKILKAFLAWEK
jgi:g-D-glutamyl-meso-diaminopimelate peptidase